MPASTRAGFRRTSNPTAIRRWHAGGTSDSLVPINQRPAGYSPLGIRNSIRRGSRNWAAPQGLFDAILNTDIRRLGAAMNHCMRCWEAILPHTVEHARFLSFESDSWLVSIAIPARCTPERRRIHDRGFRKPCRGSLARQVQAGLTWGDSVRRSARAYAENRNPEPGD